MMQFLKLLSLGAVALWGLLRALEQAIAIWVQRATRPQEAAGPATA